MNKKDRPRISGSQWRILGVLMFGVFMGALDISIVSPAIPVIAKKLLLSQREIPWIITIYLLVYVVATPLMSALSDRFGRKKIFLINVAIFGAGSLWAALSPGLYHLLTARGIQALGAGGLFPIASTVIGETIPGERRGMALGFIGLTWGVAAILGPPLGGWMTQWFGWASIFYLNIPIAVLILILVIKILPHDRGVHEHPLDFLGMLLLGSGLATLTYGLNRLHSKKLISSLISPDILPWILGALTLLAIFIIVERFPKAPVVSPRLFTNRNLNIGFYLAFTGGIAEAGLVFLPYYVMEALHLNVGTAGTIMVAGAVSLFIFTEPMGILVDRAGARFVLFIGTLFTSFGAFLLITAHNLAGFIGYQFVLGIGLSALLGAPVRYVALSETQDMDRAAAQSLVSLGNSFGTMTGTALAGAFMASNAGTLGGFHEIYMMMALVAAVGMILSMALRGRIHSTRSKTVESQVN